MLLYMTAKALLQILFSLTDVKMMVTALTALNLIPFLKDLQAEK